MVGTAATAAWTAPVIVAVSAAPALAASSPLGPAVIATTIGLVTRNRNTVTVPVTFTNTGGPTTALVAAVRIVASAGGINSVQPTVNSPDWRRGKDATVLATVTMEAEFVKLDPQLGSNLGVDNATTLEFTFSVFTQNGAVSGDITVVPAVTGVEPNSTASPASAPYA